MGMFGIPLLVFGPGCCVGSGFPSENSECAVLSPEETALVGKSSEELEFFLDLDT
jgi:hypothetical protein